MGYKKAWWKSLAIMDISVTENRISTKFREAILLAKLKQEAKEGRGKALKALDTFVEKLDTAHHLRLKFLKEVSGDDTKATDTADKMPEFVAIEGTVEAIRQQLSVLKNLIMPFDDENGNVSNELIVNQRNLYLKSVFLINDCFSDLALAELKAQTGDKTEQIKGLYALVDDRQAMGAINNTFKSLVRKRLEEQKNIEESKHEGGKESTSDTSLDSLIRKANSQVHLLVGALNEELTVVHGTKADKAKLQADLKTRQTLASNLRDGLKEAGETFNKARRRIAEFGSAVESIISDHVLQNPGHLFDKSIDAISDLMAGEAILDPKKTVADLAFDILQAIWPLLCKLFSLSTRLGRGSTLQAEYLSGCYQHILRQFMQNTAEETGLKHLKLVSACQLLLTQEGKLYTWCGNYSNDKKATSLLSSESSHKEIRSSLGQQRLEEAQGLLRIFDQVSKQIDAPQWKKSTWHPCIISLQQAFAHRTKQAKEILANKTLTNTQIDQIYQALACIYHRLITVRVFLEQTDFRAEWSSPPRLTSALYKSLSTLSNALIEHFRDNNGSNMYEFVSVIPKDFNPASLQEEDSGRRNSQASDQSEFGAILMKGNETASQEQLVEAFLEKVDKHREKSVATILLEAPKTPKPISQKPHWLIALLSLFIPANFIHRITGRQLDVHSVFRQAAQTPKTLDEASPQYLDEEEKQASEPLAY